MRRDEDVRSAALGLRGRDLVVFSNDWSGDPLSKMHIMRRLARDNRVLWVESLGNRAPRADAHDLRRVAGKLATFARGLRHVEHNLYVLTPLAVPLYGSEPVRWVNGWLVRAQVLRAMRELRFQRVVSWSFLPSSAPVSGTLGEELVVYHCVDEFSAFSDTNGQHIAELERRLLRRADLVIASAERLYASKSRENAHTVLVRHGVDFEHFVQACAESTPVPEELARLPRPRLGFFGLVADWVDLGLLEAAARAYPQGSLAVLGKVSPGVDVSRLQALPNVHLLGRKAYAELPGYCRGFDVALMPFKVNELTLNANPLKVREYLAAGLPVVSTDIPEVSRLGWCKVARGEEAFVQAVGECLAEGPGPSRERAERMRAEGWEARVEEIREHVGQALRRVGR